MKELEDNVWFPNFLRKQQTEYIGWLVRIFKLYTPVSSIIHNAAIPHNGVILDVGSGSGGPWLSLAKSALFAKTQITLSDKFPQPENTYSKNISYLQSSFDPLVNVFPTNNLLTFFNSFHHFSTAEKKQIIAIALKNKNSIFVAEILNSSWFEYIKIIFTTTIVQILLAPFVRPFRLSRLFFTWLLPINIITVTMDGIISVYKCNKNDKLNLFCEDLEKIDGFESGVKKGIFGNVYYMHLW